jgi:putative transposase
LVRKRRNWIPGATYHIISRGVRRLPIFYDDQDRRTYLAQLNKVNEGYPFILHSYCLMPNHIHLLLETKLHSPSAIMGLLHTRYAIYFKHRYQLTGHVFESRFTAKMIDSLPYFLEAGQYIHRNPIEASIPEKINDPLWSSYYAYQNYPKSSMVTTQRTLDYLGNPTQQEYKAYIEKEEIVVQK